MNVYRWSKAGLAAGIMVGAVWMAGVGEGWAAAEAAADVGQEALRTNVWTRLVEEADGMRDSPFWVYAPRIGRFVMGGGIASAPQRYDIEFFDLARREWSNAYPEGAPYRNKTGVTDAPTSATKSTFSVDDAGITRIRMEHLAPGYVSESRLHNQYAYDADANQIVVYLRDVTASFEPHNRRWTVLDTPKLNQSSSPHFNMLYGSLAYDPVNKEILSVGGTSEQDGGTPGVWALGAKRDAWRKIESGNEQDRRLQTEAAALRRETDALANRLRNRFYVTENEAESRADLTAMAGTLADRATRFAKQLVEKPAGNAARKPAAEQAAHHADALAKRARTLDAAPSRETLTRAQETQTLAWNLARALDSEPCGRGYAQMAADPKSGKIVMFGGTRKDRFLADTWVYDCASRTWEQRWPKTAPSPRAWHTLVRLPKSGKIALYGGMTRGEDPDPTQVNVWSRFTPAQARDYRRSTRVLSPLRDLWTYDVNANTWTLLAHFDEGPTGGLGAADDNDQLVMVDEVSSKRAGARAVWAMRVDPSASGKNPPPAADSPAGFATGLHPYHYDSARAPDAKAAGAFLNALPANRWQWMPEPPQSTPRRDWGTLPYDTDRHQILHWGGGHSTYCGTDLAHYSMRSASWSLGYASENPPTSSGFYTMANQTFNNRPHVPNHVWNACAYDPVSRKSVWCVRGGTWIYDPAVREWEYPPAPKPHTRTTELNISMASTPRGVVCWHARRLYLFDAQAKTWAEMPLSGATLSEAYGDTTGLCYDSKRNCLWLANRGGPMMRYDMQDGALTEFAVQGAAGVFMRETVYVPAIDMLLAMTRVQVGDKVGNLAYDIESQKWTGLVLPFDGDDQVLSDKAYWHTSGSRSLHYDPKLGVAVFLFEWNKIGVLRLDRTGLDTFAVKLRDP